MNSIDGSRHKQEPNRRHEKSTRDRDRERKREKEDRKRVPKKEREGRKKERDQSFIATNKALCVLFLSKIESDFETQSNQ